MPEDRLWCFVDFRLDAANEHLWRGEQLCSVRPKTFAVLCYLLEHSEQLVTREELLTAVWPEVVVSDGVLSECIHELRKVLGDDAKEPQYIETVHRRGYRFIGKVVRRQEAVAGREEEQPGDGETAVALDGQSREAEEQIAQALDPRLIDSGQQPFNGSAPARVWSRKVLALVAGLLIVGAMLTIRYLSLPFLRPQSLPLPDKPSIAILPFTNLSGDPEQEYFSDGLTHTLITDLSRLSDLFVIARHSVFTYKGQAVKVEEVSQELGVRYVFEGSVQKAGDRVRINVQLIDATTGGHIWAERYDRQLPDLFTLQDELVQRIVTTLGLQLSLTEQGGTRHRRTDNLDAYEYRLRGLDYFYRQTKTDMALARQMFKYAVALDPTYADAIQGLGWTYLIAWISQWDTDPQNLERALALAQQAIALDDSVPDAHWLLGMVYMHKKQHAQALVELGRTISLAPNNADSYSVLGIFLSQVGRPTEGISMIHKALRLNPRYPAYYMQWLGQSHIYAGQHKEAIPYLKQAVSRNPNVLFPFLFLAISFGELGRIEDAKAAVAALLRLNPNFSVEVWQKMAMHIDPMVTERHAAVLRKAGLE